MVVPVDGQPTVRQVANPLVSPQFPEGGVAVAFAVPAAPVTAPAPEGEEVPAPVTGDDEAQAQA
eukprot:5187995-Amphidinium_carterae.2